MHWHAGVMELVDVTDSKSVPGDRVRVRLPPPAPNKNDYCDTIVVLFFLLKSLYFKEFIKFLNKCGCLCNHFRKIRKTSDDFCVCNRYIYRVFVKFI